MYARASQAGIQSVDALSDVSVQFMVETYDTCDFSFLREETSEFALLKRLTDSMPIYRVVYANGFFNLADGRNFDREDFEKNQAVFICGNRAEEITDVNPFVYSDKEYIRIGTLFNENTIATNYGIFIAGGSAVEGLGKTELILEGCHKRCVERVFSEIADWAEKQGYTVRTLDRKESRLNDIYHVSEKGLSIVLLCILFLCSSIILIIYFWLGQYDEMREVYFLIGMRNVEAKIFADYMKIFVISCFCTIFTVRSGSWAIKGAVLLTLYIIMTVILVECLVLKRKGIHVDEKNMEGNCF